MRLATVICWIILAWPSLVSNISSSNVNQNNLVEVLRLANFRDDLKTLHKTQEYSKEIWKRGHRSLIKNNTQTELIKIVNLRILYQLNVSYAGQHVLSKVIPWVPEPFHEQVPTKLLVAREKKPLVPRVKVTKLFIQLVIAKGYGVRATTIESQNAFAPTLFQVTDEW